MAVMPKPIDLGKAGSVVNSPTKIHVGKKPSLNSYNASHMRFSSPNPIPSSSHFTKNVKATDRMKLKKQSMSIEKIGNQR